MALRTVSFATSGPGAGSGIDWNHPLAHGLVRCVLFDGATAIDLVEQSALARTGSAFAQGLTAFGPGGLNTSVGSSWQLPVRSETPRSFSMGWVGSVSASIGAGVIVRDSTSAGGSIPLWRNSGFDMRIGATDYTAAGTFAADTLYRVLVSSSGSAASLYVNGAPTIAGSVAGTTVFVSPWNIHQNGTDTTQGVTGTSHVLAIWNRPLSAAEAAEWSADPMAVLCAGIRVSVGASVGALSAAADQILSAAGQDATGAGIGSASGSQAVAASALSAAATVIAAGQATQALSSVPQAATATVGDQVSAQAAQSVPAATQTATAAAVIAGGSIVVAGLPLMVAAGAVRVAASASQALQAATQVAAALVDPGAADAVLASLSARTARQVSDASRPAQVATVARINSATGARPRQ